MMQGSPASPPTTAFVGREVELARILRSFDRVPLVVILGIAGIGKSELARAVAARWTGPTASLAGSAHVARTLAAVRRRLARTTGVLFVVDDAHEVPRAAVPRLFAAVHELGESRLLLTSRERIVIRAGDPDRLELTLDPLGRDEARRLWLLLDELYAPVAGFEEAWSRHGGNPFMLRRGHAGGLGSPDPFEELAASLDSDQRALAAILAMAGIPLPLAALGGVLDGRPAMAAVTRLVERLVVEADGAERVSIRAPFVAPVLASLGPAAEWASLRRTLVRLLPAAGLDPVTTARLMAENLRKLGQDADAERHLIEHAEQFIRSGATRQLLDAIEAIPPAARSGAGRGIRARCFLRLSELTRARDELEGLLADGAAGDPGSTISLAQLASMEGRLADASDLFCRVLADAALAPEMRTRALASYALNATHQGRGDEARQLLAAAEAAVPDRRLSGILIAFRAITLWVEERDDEAEEPMHRAQTLLRRGPGGYRADWQTQCAFGSILARLGRLDEADLVLARARKELRDQEDLASEVPFRAMGATVLWERGLPVEALEALRAVSLDFDRGGNLLGTLWAEAMIGRVLLFLGRRAEGLRVLDAAARRAEAHGIASWRSAVERSHDADPLRGGLRAEVIGRVARRSLRLHAIAAVNAAAAGRRMEALSLVETTAARAGGAGHALDRALCRLALAILAFLDGDHELAIRRIAEAAAVAAEDEVDPSLIPDLVERIGRIRLVTATGTRLVTELPDDLSSYQVVIDGRSHDLRLPDSRVISLRRRTVVQRLLYALLDRPGDGFSKEELVRRVWGADHDPLVHDNRLWVNIRHLRQLLESTGLSVENDADGYCLVAPVTFLFIDALG